MATEDKVLPELDPGRIVPISEIVFITLTIYSQEHVPASDGLI